MWKCVIRKIAERTGPFLAACLVMAIIIGAVVGMYYLGVWAIGKDAVKLVGLFGLGVLLLACIMRGIWGGIQAIRAIIGECRGECES